MCRPILSCAPWHCLWSPPPTPAHPRYFLVSSFDVQIRWSVDHNPPQPPHILRFFLYLRRVDAYPYYSWLRYTVHQHIFLELGHLFSVCLYVQYTLHSTHPSFHLHHGTSLDPLAAISIDYCLYSRFCCFVLLLLCLAVSYLAIQWSLSAGTGLLLWLEHNYHRLSFGIWLSCVRSTAQ